MEPSRKQEEKKTKEKLEKIAKKREEVGMS
jgi:hypothetical protein